LHRHAKGVEGTGGKQLLLHVGEKLGVHVVEIGFEDGDGGGFLDNWGIGFRVDRGG
jgi:hypothetical protein